MPFSQANILSVSQPVYRGAEVFLSWTCSVPGSWFQLYVDGLLAHWTQSTSCWLAAPSAARNLQLGTVLPGEEQISFASSLPPAPLRTVTLSWLGGSYSGADLAGFKVYGESTPGGGISYVTPLATITAYPAGIMTDGFGLGGYGLGGFGAVAGSYSWTSEPLTSGTWHYAVVPFDAAGNNGTASLTSQIVAVPPAAVPLSASGTRLGYTYSASTHEAVLSWLASAG